MDIIGILVLLVLAIAVVGWTCQTSMEPFMDSQPKPQTEDRVWGDTQDYDMKMKPWFGYEPGQYGPGWGRTGCSRAPSCVNV
jgi:hypothetical protein